MTPYSKIFTPEEVKLWEEQNTLPPPAICRKKLAHVAKNLSEKRRLDKARETRIAAKRIKA